MYEKTIGSDRATPCIEGSPGVHIALESSSDLYRLQPGLERAGEDSLDESFQSVFEIPQHHRNTLAVEETEVSQRDRPGTILRHSFGWVPRASGGIGRHAGFRFLCSKGREGSSPSSRTIAMPRDALHRCLGALFAFG